MKVQEDGEGGLTAISLMTSHSQTHNLARACFESGFGSCFLFVLLLCWLDEPKLDPCSPVCASARFLRKINSSDLSGRDEMRFMRHHLTLFIKPCSVVPFSPCCHLYHTYHITFTFIDWLSGPETDRSSTLWWVFVQWPIKQMNLENTQLWLCCSCLSVVEIRRIIGLGDYQGWHSIFFCRVADTVHVLLCRYAFHTMSRPQRYLIGCTWVIARSHRITCICKVETWFI